MSDHDLTTPGEFHPIPDFPGYEITQSGIIRSCRNWMMTKRPNRTKWETLKQIPNVWGYLRVFLRANGKTHVRMTHVLVLTTFVGPRPPKMDGCHNDGVITNNHLSNLRWDTRKNNLADELKHGTRLHGEKMHMTDFKESDIHQIDALRAEGMSIQQIATTFGTNHERIRRILLRETWKYTPKLGAG
jgi:hypothetical protein